MSAFEWMQSYQRAQAIIAAVREADEGKLATPTNIDRVPEDPETVVAELLEKYQREDGEA